MVGNPYRTSAPHPGAVACECGWRQPIRLHPVLTIYGPDDLKIVAARVHFVCPDCGREHTASTTQPESAAGTP